MGLTLKCESCGITVAEICEGSRIRKGAVALCARCEQRRVANELAMRARQDRAGGFGNLFEDLFGFGRGQP